MVDGVAVVLERLFELHIREPLRVHCSPMGALSGALTGEHRDPSTWRFRDRETRDAVERGEFKNARKR